MKKILIGCLIILVIAGVALGVGAYFLYRAAAPVIQNARSYLDNFSQLGELEKQIANRSRYSPPQNGELTREQIERFARVQQHIRTALGTRLQQIEAKYEHLKVTAERPQEPPMREVLSALGELGNVVVDARRAQVNAFNQEHFSAAEYDWVKGRVYRAAGVEATSVVDLQKLAEAARKGTGIEGIEAPDIPIADVPAKNRELVKPFLSRMGEWLPLAFFGF
jgi:hypothetical protein